MGSPESEEDREENEDPVDVTLTQGFWLGQYQVTQAEWEQLMGTTVLQQAENGTLNKDLAGTGSTHPMYYVSWEEAMEFCDKLTARERAVGNLPADWEYTLPTEAQWEYACRAGSTTATAFGDQLDSRQANFNGDYPYNGAAEGEDQGQTTVVGSYRPNPWNLYDMHGNLWECCRDRYVDQLPGGTNPHVEEKTRRSRVRRLGVLFGLSRVIRGGSWFEFGERCRSASRDPWASDCCNHDLGFRVALVPVQ